MTRSCCSTCRLRFSREGSSLRFCPFCAGPLQAVPATAMVGYQLFAIGDLDIDDHAVEASLARPADFSPRTSR